MKIIFIEQENLSLYSLSTGELLCHEDGKMNQDARSLLGFWSSEKIDEPFFKDEALKKEWKNYLNGDGDYYPLDPGETSRHPEMDGFLWGCDDYSSRIAFQIKTTSQPETIVWVVVETEVKDEITAGSENLKSEKPGNYDPAARNVSITAKEARRFKKLGDIGEHLALMLLEQHGFIHFHNLNNSAMNFPFADFMAEKDGVKYLISVKARNKYENTGRLNARFKLGDTDKKIQKLRNDEKFAPFKDYVPAWMAIALDKHTYEAYWGLIDELPNKRGISMSEKAKQNYRCLAKDQPHDFDYNEFGNSYSYKEETP